MGINQFQMIEMQKLNRDHCDSSQEPDETKLELTAGGVSLGHATTSLPVISSE